VKFGKCPNEDHDYHYTEYDDGHELIICTYCTYVFVDTRNRLSAQERRDLIGSVFGAMVALPLIWLFVVIVWGALG